MYHHHNLCRKRIWLYHCYIIIMKMYVGMVYGCVIVTRIIIKMSVGSYGCVIVTCIIIKIINYCLVIKKPKYFC